MAQVEKLTISLPKEIVLFADKLAKEKKTSRSKVIALCLKEAAKQRELAELEEGYRVMGKENEELAKLTYEAQREVVTKWK